MAAEVRLERGMYLAIRVDHLATGNQAYGRGRVSVVDDVAGITVKIAKESFPEMGMFAWQSADRVEDQREFSVQHICYFHDYPPEEQGSLLEKASRVTKVLVNLDVFRFGPEEDNFLSAGLIGATAIGARSFFPHLDPAQSAFNIHDSVSHFEANHILAPDFNFTTSVNLGLRRMT